MPEVAQHEFHLALHENVSKFERSKKINIFGKLLIDHVRDYFRDTTKLENLESQIFYHNKLIFNLVSCADHESALDYIKQLLLLLKSRAQLSDDTDP